jgi:hypothetical protein
MTSRNGRGSLGHRRGFFHRCAGVSMTSTPIISALYLRQLAAEKKYTPKWLRTAAESGGPTAPQYVSG